MADETLRFDIVGDDNLSEPLNRSAESTGKLSRAMDAAARMSAIMDAALKRQASAARTSVDATLTLARADKILEEAEHGLAKGALEAEFALKKQAEAAKQSGAAAVLAAAQNKAFRDSLKGLSFSPGLAGPALLLAPAATTLAGVAAGATVGIAGAAVAGAAALAAFGAVAKPVLSQALTAEQAVQAAQVNYTAAIAGGTKQAVAYKAEQIAINKAYAEMSPAQIALSKQLGAMSDAWSKVKAAQTPVAAGALQPWLKAVTDLTGKLAPIIAKVAPVIKEIGTQFDILISSSAFQTFMKFIAGTGSQAVAAAGNLLTGFLDAVITLLPKFNPLIQAANRWLYGLGDSIARWANSQKTADQITAFMKWFSQNGPVVGDLLKNIGAALKNLAPGLTAGGAAEIKVISDFLGWVAKLPKDIAKPLTETAGALLIMSKMGVLKVGVQLAGPAAKWLSGGLINIGGGDAAAAAMRAAFTTGGAAAAAEMRAALASGGAAAGAGGAAGGAGAKGAAGGLGAGGLAATAGELLGIISLAAAAGIAIGEIFSKITTGKFENFAQWKKKFESSLDSMRHAAASFGDGVVQDWNLVWANTITRTARGFHDLAGWFDTGRHDIAAHMNQIMSNVIDAWNKIWNNTIGRIQRGFHDTAGLFDTGRHTIAATFDSIRHDIAAKWDLIWSDTVTKVTTGIGKVVTFFQQLPGKVVTALGNAATTLYNWGAGVITGMLSGIKSVWSGVLSFFGGLSKAILHAIGINSPPGWAIDAGKQIMAGLGIGINAHLQHVVGNAKAAAAAVSGALGTGGVSNTSGVAALKSAAAKHGWTSAAEWAALNAVEMREAGYSLTARNPSSGAYGMAQFIGGPSEYAQYGGNSTTYAGQATAMANYIAQRYGDPIAAWAHEQAYGWYGSGLDAMFSRPTLIGVGERGPERVQVTPSRGGGGMSAGEQAIVAALADMSRRIDNLTGVTASVPRATGQHVGAAIGGAAHDASFRSRYH